MNDHQLIHLCLIITVFWLSAGSGEAQESTAPPLPQGLEANRPEEQDIPPLPVGLEAPAILPGEPAPPADLKQSSSDSGPALPQGLIGSPATDEPQLPAGIDQEPEETATTVQAEAEEASAFLEDHALFGFPLHGFWELRNGWRTQNDPNISRDMSIGETRLQLETERDFGAFAFDLSSDFYYDAVTEEFEIDLRTANISASPLDFMDIRLGRQILTWGTGDLLFINDLFPKDWQSFFIGRDEEYLKAPSDAVKTSFFTEWVNLDIVYTPQFDHDRYIRGERISYWSDRLGRRAGIEDPLDMDDPEEWFTDDELAFRLYRNISAYEFAVYGYRGFWKSPGGFAATQGRTTFPALSVYGSSLRGNLWQGIGNLEVGYYLSEDDENGDDPFVRNSEFRFLMGYEQEIRRNLTLGVQYYLEYMMDYGDYRSTLPASVPDRDEDRHVLALRLTQLLLEQDLTLSGFTYYSPSDEDLYLRLNAHYKITDHWSTELGANIFLGEQDHTFFGQFEDNTNVYAGIRYAF